MLCYSHDATPSAASVHSLHHFAQQQLLLTLTCISHVTCRLRCGAAGPVWWVWDVAPLPWEPASCDMPRWRLACRLDAGRSAVVEIVLGDREYLEIEATKRLISLCSLALDWSRRGFWCSPAMELESFMLRMLDTCRCVLPRSVRVPEYTGKSSVQLLRSRCY